MMKPLTAEQRADKAVFHYGAGVPSGATPEQILYAIEAANPCRAAQVAAVATAIRAAEAAAVAKTKEGAAKVVEAEMAEGHPYNRVFERLAAAIRRGEP